MVEKTNSIPWTLVCLGENYGLRLSSQHIFLHTFRFYWHKPLDLSERRQLKWIFEMILHQTRLPLSSSWLTQKITWPVNQFKATLCVFHRVENNWQSANWPPKKKVKFSSFWRFLNIKACTIVYELFFLADCIETLPDNFLFALKVAFKTVSLRTWFATIDQCCSHGLCGLT